jgi:hypothetical protein
VQETGKQPRGLLVTEHLRWTLENLFGHIPPLASRYADHMSRPRLPYPHKCSDDDAIQRLSVLNHWLLDGYTFGDHPCTASCHFALSPEEIRKKAASTRWQGIAAVIADTAFRIRAAQEFLDGNHRSAVLYIFESCTAFDRCLDTDPLVLYTLISCRDYATSPNDAIDLLTREISSAQWKRISDDEVEIQALLVKQLPVKVSGYFQLVQELGRLTSEDAVVRLRKFKHQDGQEYALFARCFKREIGKVFKVVYNGGVGALKRQFVDHCLERRIKFVPSED